MRSISDPNVQSWAKRTWVPTKPEDFSLNSKTQPYIKLHRSSNWQQEANQQEPILIMGGSKVCQISMFPILNWYQKLFKKQLFQSNVRLMVIGYGFRDLHINEILTKAIDEHHLQMFIIGPSGDNIDKNFKEGLIGVSCRSLSEIFGNDIIEFDKVMRFFSIETILRK
jgi:hypothetical protein